MNSLIRKYYKKFGSFGCIRKFVSALFGSLGFNSGHSDRFLIRSIRIIKRSLAFTLLEVLLSVGLIGAITAVSIPLYLSYSTGNDIDIAANTTVQSLRRAQILSQAVQNDATWGVKILNGSITLFKGVDYNSRDTSYDEIFNTPTIIQVSGTSEFVFYKMTGLPIQTGTLTLTSTNNDIKNIVINSKGMIGY